MSLKAVRVAVRVASCCLNMGKAGYTRASLPNELYSNTISTKFFDINMSFGFSIGDFITVINLANEIRKDFAAAPEHYQGVSADVKSLSIILQDVDTLIAGNELSQDQEEKLCEIGGRCKKVLEDVSKALNKYSSLSKNHATSRNKGFTRRVKRVWQQITFEPLEFRDYRNAIISNVSLLNTFMNSITRDGMIKLIGKQEHQEDQAILEWLSTAEYAAQQASNIRQRLESTGRWLLESPEYKRWICSSKEVLFLHGIAGAGKTILSSIVINDLQEICCEDEGSGLIYFYCDYSRQDTQQIDIIMLAWLRQLAEGFVVLPYQIKELYSRCQKKNTRPEFQEVKTIVHSIAASLTKLYIVVDALDECQTIGGRQRQLVDEILHLSRTIRARAIATSRPIPHIEAMFDKCMSMEIRATVDDIRSYVDGNMADLPDFLINSSELQEQVKANIIESADGLYILHVFLVSTLTINRFLLAKLNMETLKGITTKKKFRIALGSLLQHRGNYAEAYEKTMALINCQRQGEKEQALMVLAWIVLSQRPLTVLELFHALAIEPGSGILDEDNIPELSSIISVCHGLVTVVAETGIVQLIHFTTQEFFKGTGSRWVQPLASNVTNACLSYLSLSEFDTGACNYRDELRLRLEKFPFYEYASYFWGFHARSKADSAMIQDFFNHEKHMAASSQILLGTRRFHRSPTTSWTPIHFVAYFGLHDWVDYVLQLSAIDSVDLRKKSALMYAAERGHEAVVRLLLEKGAQADSTTDGYTALILASKEDQEAIVRLLLDNGAQVDSADKFGKTALIYAASNGNEAVVRILLERGAQVDLADENGYTALMEAARDGNEAVVRLLLKRDAQVDFADEDGMTALMVAAMYGKEAVVRLLLLERAADVDATDNDGRRASKYAPRYSRKDIIDLLSKKKPDPAIVS